MAAAHGHIDHHTDKRIALLISVLALVLAFSETLGNATQTSALSANIEATNLWSFYQAKAARQAILNTAAELLEAQAGGVPAEAARKQAEKWRQTAARYQSDAATREGRAELGERAKQVEARRDRALAAYHNYEIASAAVQIAVVLASASIITETMALAWIAGALGLAGAALCVIGFWFPTAVHML
ncbi:MAG TPA: DUF4337 domain-containing protein [Burkholderiales bacterium]|nr:DUF4337 domain-containing protein [Burkholderiales bacterium]